MRATATADESNGEANATANDSIADDSSESSERQATPSGGTHASGLSNIDS